LLAAHAHHWKPDFAVAVLEETAAKVGFNRYDADIQLDGLREEALRLVGTVAWIDLFDVVLCWLLAFHLGLGAAGEDKHLELRVLADDVLEPGA